MWTHGAPVENLLRSRSRGYTSNATANIMFWLAPGPKPNTVVIHAYGIYGGMDHSISYYSRLDLDLHYVGFLLNLNSKDLFWVLTHTM